MAYGSAFLALVRVAAQAVIPTGSRGLTAGIVRRGLRERKIREAGLLAYLRRMAHYNQWINRRLLQAAARLPDDALRASRGAPYDSIFGTLNHIFQADVLWLIRFGSHEACHALGPIGDIPAPTSLSELLFVDLEDMRDGRETLDELIIDFSKTWTEEMLAVPIRFTGPDGQQHAYPLDELLQNLFTHQTHHRGQAIAMLAEAGADPGPTDLLSMLAEG